MGQSAFLEDRKEFIGQGGGCGSIKCDSNSLSGAVSQRACVYCGARVVLNPITDAYHIVHGPIGCASYTWDIRGSLSSGSEVYRNSFSTDLGEKDVVFGGAKKLTAAIDELVEAKHPKLIFVYATCIVGVIGDDVEAICRQAEAKYGIRVIPVQSPGFSGNKSFGYKMACNALMTLLKPHIDPNAVKSGINILGDYNLAGEMWIIENYMRELGIAVKATFTGDSSYEKLLKAPTAALNIVQCAGSMTYLAKRMEEEMGIPYIRVSFFGVDDTSASLRTVAQAIGTPDTVARAEAFTRKMTAEVTPQLEPYRKRLKGKRAAIFVGGGFKAISLIREFNALGMKPVVVGTQTGRPEEYEMIASLVDADTVVLDDANPAELEHFMKEKQADILVGGVKERPLAYKLGVAFCDHNHERKHAMAGYEGVLNFTREIYESIASPVFAAVKHPLLCEEEEHHAR
ncbi:MAG TPA: nitrogenase iron-molybdenum cofactor biosynthesis protein NifE [Candidatus Limiplasma sp.]|nr:nitrogenase iron-molybdenum cofactor biosynthesis protein NifE [Candidatus Limiplasma sp.]HRX07842.1 nitrogenase iron-molybdenum cofactor biosynthesis protein NifE [Candidatus Limiplasma sp.]